MTKPADAPSGEPLALRCNDVLAVVEDAPTTCPRCTQAKPRAAFGLNAKRKNGLQAYCKQCRREQSASKAGENAARYAEWRKKNLERVKKARADKYWADAEAARTAARAYSKAHPERQRERWARERKELGDLYVAAVMGLRKGACPPELLALKREQLATRRLARQLKKATDESSKDPH